MIQVFDASAVVDMLVGTGATGRWCEDRAAEGALAAPHLMPVEAANLLRRTEARGLIDSRAAGHALRRLVWLPADYLPFDVLAARAWDLRHNLTTYDACYVAAAERLGARLVTLDRKLSAASGLRCDVLVGPV